MNDKHSENTSNEVLIITSNFRPELSGVALYTTDLVETLIREDFGVTVLTCKPHYPNPELYINSNLELNEATLFLKCRVVRINIPLIKKGRLLERFWFEINFLNRGLFSLLRMRNKKISTVIAVEPSLSAALLGAIYSRLRRVPLMTIFQDLVSAASTESGIRNGKFFAWPIRYIENFVIKNSDRIIAISDNMKVKMEESYKPKCDIDVIHNYTVISVPELSKTMARTELDIEQDSFVVMMTGSLAIKQDLRNLVQAAASLSHHLEILFIILGNGYQELEFRSQVDDLKNLKLISLVPDKLYPIYLRCADAFLVMERDSVGSMSLPSRLTSYFPLGKPVIMVTNEHSATKGFVGENAIWVKPGNHLLLARAIAELRNNLEMQSHFSRQSILFAKNYLNPDNGRNRYLSILREYIPSD